MPAMILQKMQFSSVMPITPLQLRGLDSDTWSDGTASYLAMITPRLILMRELLADTGSIYVHLDWHVGHYVKLVLDEIFGRTKFLNEVIWHYQSGGRQEDSFSKKHDVIFWYSKFFLPKLRFFCPETHPIVFFSGLCDTFSLAEVAETSQILFFLTAMSQN